MPFAFEILQEARLAGCVTAAKAQEFIEHKRTKEAEEKGCKGIGHIGTGAKTLQKSNYLKGELDSSLQGLHKDSRPTVMEAITRSLEEWDISGFEGAELLSESVRTLPLVYQDFIFSFYVANFFFQL